MSRYLRLIPVVLLSIILTNQVNAAGNPRGGNGAAGAPPARGPAAVQTARGNGVQNAPSGHTGSTAPSPQNGPPAVAGNTPAPVAPRSIPGTQPRSKPAAPSHSPKRGHAVSVSPHLTSGQAGSLNGNGACNVNKPCPKPVPTNLALNPASGACVYNHGMAVSAGRRPAGSPPNKDRSCTGGHATIHASKARTGARARGHVRIHVGAGKRGGRGHHHTALLRKHPHTHAGHGGKPAGTGVHRASVRKHKGCRHAVITISSVQSSVVNHPPRRIEGGTRAGALAGNGACNVNKPCPTPVPANLALNPASGACVYNHGMAVSAAHRPAGSPPDKHRTCTPSNHGVVTAREQQASDCMASSRDTAPSTQPVPAKRTVHSTHRSTITSRQMSQARVRVPSTFLPAVVPARATVVSRAAVAGGVRVVYRAGNTLYRVRYHAHGAYKVSMAPVRPRHSTVHAQVKAAYIHVPSRHVHASRTVTGTVPKAGGGPKVVMLPATGGAAQSGLGADDHASAQQARCLRA